jgi:uncharacterized phiE125 gp8 family phage protein
MRKELRVGPANPAITLADLKVYGYVKNTDRDDELSALIPVAINYVEDVSGRALVNQEFDVWYDRDEFWQMIQNGFAYLSTLNVSSIDSITLYAVDGTATVVDPTTYRLADNKAKFDQILPSGATRNMDAVKIEVTAGYGADDTEMPEPLKTAMYAMCMHWFHYNGDVGTEALKHIPDTVKTWLTPYKSTINWFN